MASRALVEKELYLAALLQTGQPDKAIAVYPVLFKAEKPSLGLQVALIHVRIETASLQQGLPSISELWKQHPNNPRVLDEMGLSAWRLGNTERAKLLFTEAIKNDPFFAPAHLELGKVAAQRDYPDEVRRHCSQVLLLAEPGSPLAQQATDLLAKYPPRLK
jgi:tetratricopeptide (TPR) repeat protein